MWAFFPGFRRPTRRVGGRKNVQARGSEPSRALFDENGHTAFSRQCSHAGFPFLLQGVVSANVNLPYVTISIVKYNFKVTKNVLALLK